jgi:hypothetical protein
MHDAASLGEERPHLADGPSDGGAVNTERTGEHVRAGGTPEMHERRQIVKKDFWLRLGDEAGMVGSVRPLRSLLMGWVVVAGWCACLAIQVATVAVGGDLPKGQQRFTTSVARRVEDPRALGSDYSATGSPLKRRLSQWR